MKIIKSVFLSVLMLITFFAAFMASTLAMVFIMNYAKPMLQLLSFLNGIDPEFSLIYSTVPLIAAGIATIAIANAIAKEDSVFELSCMITGGLLGMLFIYSLIANILANNFLFLNVLEIIAAWVIFKQKR